MPRFDEKAALELFRAIVPERTREALGPRGREALLGAAFLLALADGEIRTAELACVRALATALGIEGGDVEVVSAELDAATVATRLGECQLTLADRDAVIACLGLLAKVDAELEDRESAMIEGIGAALGRNKKECRAILSRVIRPQFLSGT